MNADERAKDEFGTQRLVVVGDRSPVWIPARALSICQPWAYLMLIDSPYRKDVENRPTGFVQINFRGPVWIHASAKAKRPLYDKAQTVWNAWGGPVELFPTWEQVVAAELPGLNRGGIVGRATFTDYLKPEVMPRKRWHFGNHHGFTTDAARLTPFVPCKGQLGFWRIPPDVAQTLAAWTLSAGR
jgi:hypothetical protein